MQELLVHHISWGSRNVSELQDELPSRIPTMVCTVRRYSTRSTCRITAAPIGEGNIVVADPGNHRARKIAADGTVTTLVGTGVRSYLDGPGTAAMFASPLGRCGGR